MRNILLPFFITLIFFAFVPRAFGANTNDILINEIAWMGTTTSGSDEWLELYNITANDINLSNWILKSSDEKIKIPLKGIILANGFYLLERTDDKSLPTITADFIYKGSLSNTGMNLQLFDASGIIIDQASFISGWPTGDNTTKQTMERMPNKKWQTSKDVGGTPKALTSTGKIIVAKKSTTSLPKTDKIDMSKKVNPSPIVTSSQDEDIQNPWLLFLSVLLVMIILATSIIIIKIKLTKLHERS